MYHVYTGATLRECLIWWCLLTNLCYRTLPVRDRFCDLRLRTFLSWLSRDGQYVFSVFCSNIYFIQIQILRNASHIQFRRIFFEFLPPLLLNSNFLFIKIFDFFQPRLSSSPSQFWDVPVALIGLVLLSNFLENVLNATITNYKIPLPVLQSNCIHRHNLFYLQSLRRRNSPLHNLHFVCLKTRQHTLLSQTSTHAMWRTTTTTYPPHPKSSLTNSRLSQTFEDAVRGLM